MGGWRGNGRIRRTDYSQDSPTWLAGLLEGEGCFYWSKSLKLPVLSLRMTDLDIVERVARICDVAIQKGRGALSHYKAQYVISLRGKAAFEIMFTLFPLLGVRRRAKISELLARWEHGG